MGDYKAEIPAARRGRPPSMRLEAIRRNLRNRPGEWAIIDKRPTHGQAAGQIRSLMGKHQGGSMKYPGYECKVRTQPDGMVHVWARWVGLKAAPEVVAESEAQEPASPETVQAPDGV